MPDFIEDERGYIQELDLGDHIDAVLEIMTRAGCIRGNHWHRDTTHWTYVVSGKLQIRNGGHTITAGPGCLVEARPGMEHAWVALEDTVALEFKRGAGARGQENYEADVVRLEVPLL